MKSIHGEQSKWVPIKLKRGTDQSNVECNPNHEPQGVEIHEVLRAGKTGDAIGNFVLNLAGMLPVHALVRNFPMREVKKFAVFNSIGLIDDSAGFAGKRRVWSGIRHGSTVCL